MTSDCSAASWLKFFSSAGIPLESAQAYASTFSIHEICMDMLLDLKKEYLTEMGITLFGHIIAILRHAKTFHDTLRKTGVNKVTKTVPDPPSVPKGYTKNISKKDASIETDAERPVKSSELLLKPVNHVNQSTSSGVVGKKRKVTESDEILSSKPIKSVLKQREHVVEKKTKVESEKKRVFERLGLDSSVSSSTEVDSNGTMSPDSVFLRLGGKSGVSSSMQESKESLSLQYHGVLKTPGSPVRTVMRPTVGKSVTLKSSIGSPKVVTLKKLISDTITSSNPVCERKVSIKDRLGRNRSSPQASSRQLSTKGRLVSREQMPDSSTGYHAAKKVSFGSVSQKLIPMVKKSPAKAVSHLYSSLPEVPVYSRLGDTTSRVPLSPGVPMKRRYL